MSCCPVESRIENRKYETGTSLDDDESTNEATLFVTVKTLYFMLKPFCMITGSKVIAAVPVSHEWRCTNFSCVHCSY
jgi:hypothetical protein